MRSLVIVIFVLFCSLLAQAQTCSDGQSPIWSATTGWTCGAITPGPLPAGSSLNMTIANAGATGTTANRLAKLTGAPSTAVVTATTDTEGAIGVCVSGCGTTGSATVAIIGQVSCEFDGATTAGNYVVISATTAGMCHDAGSAFPTAQAAYGRVLSTNGGAGTYVMELMTPDLAFQNGGNGKSKPATPDKAVQFNDGQVFGGTSDFSYDKTTRILSLTQTNNGRIGWSNTAGSIAFGGFGAAGVGTVKILSDGTAAGALYSPETAMTTAGGDPRPFVGLAGQVQTFTLTSNKPLGMVGTDGGTVAKDGTFFTVILKQDATGARVITWNAGYKFPGGVAPVLTVTANAVDIFTFLVSGSGTVAYLVYAAQDVK